MRTLQEQYWKLDIRWVVIPLAVALLALLSLALAWISTTFQSVEGWPSFLGSLALGAALLLGGWVAVKAGERDLPRWLGAALVAAAIIRLALGAVWFAGLPKYGYEGEAENAGYVMVDAYDRDLAAWELAQSDKPLARAFQGGYRRADQYGGLLFVSAWLYRYLGGAVHQPLMMITLTAAVSALACLFTWSFTRRAWGEPAATIASLGLALYPEAALLGSSQMREAFTVTFTIAAFYGLVRYRQTRAWPSLLWTLGAVLLYLPFSPPFTILLAAMLLLGAFGLGRRLLGGKVHRSWRFWLVVAGVSLLVLAGAYLAFLQFAPEGMTNPIEVASWWLRKSADTQAYRTRAASGWLQKIFANTPESLHTPILAGYGVLQPFLPAAILDAAAPIWWAISIWRALGWSLLLPFLLYAAFLAIFGSSKDRFARMVVVIVWLVILIAGFRAGSDQWDNSRYRATFAGLQFALAAWAVVEQQRSQDPWMRRVLVGMALVLAWFVPWYLRRYPPFTWYVTDVFRTLGLGLASAALYAVWDWARPPKAPPQEAGKA